MAFSDKFTKCKAQYAVAFAFLFLAICGGVAIKWSADSAQTKLYNSQIAGCERVNLLRSESNKRTSVHNTEKQVLDQFIASAVDARSQSGDKDVAAQYQILRVKLASIKFNNLPLIDCHKVIEKP